MLIKDTKYKDYISRVIII